MSLAKNIIGAIAVLGLTTLIAVYVPRSSQHPEVQGQYPEQSETMQPSPQSGSDIAHAPSLTSAQNVFVQEEDRIKTPVLQAYENAIEPIAQKMGNTNAVAICGIRGRPWQKQTLAGLERYLRQPEFEEMKNRLSADELLAAERHKRAAIKAAEDFVLGIRDRNAACQELSNMPFINIPGSFSP